MTLNPHIERYLSMVETGEIRTCEDQKLLAVYVRRCFDTEDIYVDDEQLEKYIGLTKYMPWEPFPWQKFLIALHYCTYWRDSGMPRWPDMLALIARGAGKDGTIAWEGLCAISPYNGIEHYDVDICGNIAEQATRPCDDLREAFESPDHRKKLLRHFYWNSEKIVGRATKSVMKGRTNNPGSRDGMRSGVVIFNEVHQYQNYANINVFTTGLGKKKHPRRSYYTTQGNIRDGVLDDLLATSDGILRGGDPDDGLLPFICRLDAPDEVDDPENWVKANPSLPYLPILQAETAKEYAAWKRTPNQLTDFMTKRMNLPQSNKEVQVTDWANIIATDRELPEQLDGWSCIIGIDYAKVSDFISVNAHFRDGDRRYDINHSWLCLQSADLPRIKAPWKEWADRNLLTLVDDVEIHPDVIAAYIQDIGAKYNISGLAMDNYRWTLLSNSLKSIGFDPKSKDGTPVKLVRPSDIMRVFPVIDSCFANHFFTWGDNPVLRWATNNTKLIRVGRQSGEDIGNYVYGKIEARSRKTDPFMALVHSMTLEGELGDGGAYVSPMTGVITY